MCGMCGYAWRDRERPVDRERLGAMRRALAHRGPDGCGEYGDRGVALAHTRLSIIDLAGGAQPLANEDGSVWVSFNGEIYNFAELRAELVTLGHYFHTSSDTEVLVHGYEEWGLDLPQRLNGMFAFAIHDRVNRRLVLARDHLGIKPLFYAVTAEGLFFGSEIKAVTAGAQIEARARRESVAEYLTFRYTAGSRTFYDGVERLRPGHVAVWRDGRLETRQFWTAPVDAPDIAPSVHEATEQFATHLKRSVGMQLMSDVPLGTFCSGGIDSGLVSAFAARQSPHKLHTFSVGFEDPAWDESELARETSGRYDTEHHVLTMRSTDFAPALSSLVWYHDEPLSHPNSVPLYLLSKFARQHVTVVLTGEGSDELLAGYPRYHIVRLRGALEMLPGGALRATAAMARRAPGHRAAKLADLLPEPFIESVILNSAYVHPSTVAKLTGIEVRDVLDERRRLFDQSAVSGDALATISRYEMRTYLQCALDRMDRMSMASGLEGRVPFLDVPLVEWGTRLDSSLKTSGRTSKRVARALGQRLLGPKVNNGPKSGFGLPLDDWFRDPMLAPLVSAMRDPAHPAADLFDRSALSSLLDEHGTGRANHGEALWLVSNVFLWHEVQRASSATTPEVAAAA